MRPGRSARARKILKHLLARDAGVGVDAGRRNGRRRFGRAAVPHIDIRINAAGRIGDDARAREGLGDQRRHMRIHRPGQILGAGGAELAAGHEHDVRKFRQRLDLGAVEQIGLDAFDAPARQLLAQALLAETRNADDALSRGRALGEPRQRRSDLSANSQNDEIARNSFRSRRRGPPTARSSPLRDGRRRENDRAASLRPELRRSFALLDAAAGQ